MADVAAAVPATSSPKAKKVKAAKKTGAPASHPPYGDMVRRAIADLKDKKGSSRAAILKYILQHFKVGGNIIQVNAHIRQALKRGTSTGALKQVKGVGASGSFRIGEKAAVKAKKPKAAKKAKAPGSPKKAKKTGVKKAAGVKKPKSPKKAKSPKKTKSPKKAKAAKPKKAKAPKKASPKKKAAPKKVAKKAAAPAVSA
ncbi:putative histone H1.6 [Aphelenchoides bicaudatus]|nr:putative histone H1.6 [Aphelenchoides bicaudatus]